MVKSIKTRIATIALLGLIVFFSGCLTSPEKRNKELFKWTCNKLELSNCDDYKMPKVVILPRMDLIRLYQDTCISENCLVDWKDLKYLVGLYIPKTGIVYAIQELWPINQKSVIVHEMVHHFQVIEAIYVPHVYRELHAYAIQAIYLKEVKKK